MIMEYGRREKNEKNTISWKGMFDSKQKGEVKYFMASSLSTQRLVLNTDC